ncbi:SGNH/GDSL hydrolase family protein [Lutibacter sp.]|uniref:SGNH/GDSL hydrolase family protein n=1 Tax=Lutibacter sp. TaxID=1925666 RepID=UPI0034A09E81
MTKIKIMLMLILAITSCNEKSNKNDFFEAEQETPVEMEPENNTTKNYLALGDSYTIGQSVPENDRFPVLLVNDLNAKDYNFNAPKIIAQTGWTTGELKSAILQENISEKYDLVTLLIGVNNQYRGNSIDVFRTEFIELLNMAISFAGNNRGNVIVVSIPDWAVSPYAENRDRSKISKEIDLFNTVKKEETLKMNIKFVDITPVSRQALNKSQFFASDGLHFSGEMHQLWVDEIMTLF